MLNHRFVGRVLILVVLLWSALLYSSFLQRIFTPPNIIDLLDNSDAYDIDTESFEIIAELETTISEPVEMLPQRLSGSFLPLETVLIDAGACSAHPPQTAALQPLVGPNCPVDKYLIFLPYSGMNNGIRQLVAAALMAKRLQRTVLLADSFSFDWGLFEFGDLCIERASEERINELKDTAPYSDFLLLMPEFSTKHFMHDIGCVVDTVLTLKASENALLTFNQTFFTSISKKSYLDTLQHLRFSSKISDLGDQFIRESLGDEKFVGVHVRWFAGECFDQMNNIFVKELAPYHSDAINSCGVTWSYIVKMMLAHGYDPDVTKILLTSDGEQPYIVRHLTQHPSIYRYNGEHGAMVDMYLLSKCSLLLGNPYSSFSFHVALWREISGFPRETNAIPGYVETGYLHHLFFPGPVELPQ